MIQFPETAQTEWQIIADAAAASTNLRKRIELDTLVEKEVERLRIRHEASLKFQQQLDADTTPPLEMITLTQYRCSPTTLVQNDLIDGVMKEQSLCLMIGPSGSGKSTLALQTVHSLSTGADFLGQKSQKIAGGFGVMSYDMHAGMALDWLDGMPGVDADRVSVINAFKRGNPLAVSAQREQIVAAWRAMNCEVVIIDSFSASFPGTDQNDAGATMAHYRDLKTFALTEVGAKALIVITHSTSASPNKARGSTVHEDVADTMLSVVADPAGIRTVSMVKYRALRGQTQMDPVIITAPDSVTHLVDLDPNNMTLAGMKLPASLAGSAFSDLPEAYDTPDTDSDAGSPETEGDDDL